MSTCHAIRSARCATRIPETVSDLFAAFSDILSFMRQCVSCGDPIDSRRKDSKFCPKAKCRAKEYRRRQAEAAAAPEQRHDHQMSAVFGCPCGRRFLLQVSSLEDQPAEAMPTETPTIVPRVTVTQTVLPPEQPLQAAASHATSPASAAAENSSEQFAKGSPNPAACEEIADPVAATPSILPVAPPAGAAVDAAPALSPPLSRPQLRTFELYFTDQGGRPAHFWNVVRKYGTNIWRVVNFARPSLGFSRLEGAGLGGTPGRWHDVYPLRDPSEFGHDSDLAVLCWDEQDGRAYAAEVELLQAALGDNWKTLLREARDQRSRIGDRLG